MEESARTRAALACVAATAAAIALAAVPAADHGAAAGSSCSGGRRSMPGAGKLEWKRSGRAPVRVRGLPSLPYVITGHTLLGH